MDALDIGWDGVLGSLKSTTVITKLPNYLRSRFSVRYNVFFTVLPDTVSAIFITAYPRRHSRHETERLRISIGKPNFVLPNLDSVNHCTSKEISIEIKRYLLVQWLTESIFGKTKFGFPIEIRSNQQRESHVCGDRL